MSDKELVLSICIPTYNRANYLTECLDSVLNSVKGFEDEIEIIISDNASTDNTTVVVNEYLKKYNFIVYNRNESNVIDENFFIAINSASGKYIWLFADDDLMEPNAVKIVISKIKEDYNIIVCNYTKWDKSFTQLLAPKEYLFNKDFQINNHDELLKKFSIRIQLISSLIIKRRFVLSINKNEYKNLHEFGISYIYVIYSSLINNVNGIFLKDTLIKYRGYNSDIIGKERWYKYFVTGSNLLFDLLKHKGYKAYSIWQAKETVLRKYVFHDLSNRKRNEEDLGGLLEYLIQFYIYNLSFWILIVPLLIFPKGLVILCRKVVLKIKFLL